MYKIKKPDIYIKALRKTLNKFIRSIKRLTFTKFILIVFLLAAVTFSLLPFVYVISNAFKPLNELFIFPPRFFVEKPSLINFQSLVTIADNSIVPFSRYIFNSIIVSVLGVFLSALIATMSAYAVSKLKLKFSGIYFNIIIMALMFSPYVTQIPKYLIVNQLGLIDNFWSLIVPGLATAYSLFLMKQFIDQFPDVLLEASKIDGASEYRIFFQIVLPNLKPAISTLVLFSFIAFWNDGFSPLIYVTNQSLKTLPIGLATIGGGGIGRAGAVAAATLLTTIPSLILFTVTQKQVVQTMTYSGIKA